MTNLRSRLRDIERIEPPELWQKIVAREPKLPIRSRSRGRVVLAVAVAVSILAAGVLLPLTLLKLGRQSRAVGPPPSSAAPSPGLVLPTPGPVTLLLAGEQAFYAVYQTGAPNPAAELLRRDFRTAVVRGADFTSVSDLELAGGWLWVSGQLWMRDQQKPGPMGLFRLDPRTLQIRGTVALPAAGALASSPAGLWVGDGDRLDLVDAAGTIIRVLKADGEVGAFAVDPTGRFLYVATTVSSDDITPRSITERDASTGAVIATVPGPPGIAVTRLSATVDGVWVSISSGLLGQVAFLRAGDLHQTAAFISRGGEAGTNSVHANVGAGVLWVADDMVGSLWCADPATGNVRAPLERPASADGYGMSDIVTLGSDAYIGTGHGVFRLAPDPRCDVSS